MNKKIIFTQTKMYRIIFYNLLLFTFFSLKMEIDKALFYQKLKSEREFSNKNQRESISVVKNNYNSSRSNK